MSPPAPPLVGVVLARGMVGLAALGVLRPPPPAAPLANTGVAVALGTGTGLLLLVALAGRLPPCARLHAGPLTPLLAAGSILTLGAAAEELIWRRVLLAALVPSLGTPVALLVTSVGFALSHASAGRRAVATHLVTGAAFGGAFLATASFAAAAAAHVTYNVGALLAATFDGRARAPRGARP